MRYALLSYRGEDTTDCHGESMNPKHQITATPGRPQASYGLADSLRAGRHPTAAASPDRSRRAVLGRR